MNAVAVAPLRRSLAGARVRVPPASGAAIRELALSALASARSRVVLGPLDPGADTRIMAEALRAFGHEIDDAGDHIDIRPHPSAYAHGAVDALGSGAVANALITLAACRDAETRVMNAPNAALSDAVARALTVLGASVTRDGTALVVRGPLRGGVLTLQGREGAEVAASVLVAAPSMRDGLQLRDGGHTGDGPVAAALAALRSRGVRVAGREAAHTARVKPQRVAGRTVTLAGSAAHAMYPAAAAAILGGDVTIANVSIRSDGDGEGCVPFFGLLGMMGCRVRAGASTSIGRRGELNGVSAHLEACPGAVAALLVAATHARTPTQLVGLDRESRAVAGTMAAVLTALGGDVELFADGIRVTPRPLHGAAVDPAGDHRVAMAAAVLALGVPGITVGGADAVARVYPGFFAMLAALGSA